MYENATQFRHVPKNGHIAAYYEFRVTPKGLVARLAKKEATRLYEHKYLEHGHGWSGWVPLEANFVRFKVSRKHTDKTVKVRCRPRYTFMGSSQWSGHPRPRELGACPKGRRMGEDPWNVQKTLVVGEKGANPTRRSSSLERRVP